MSYIHTRTISVCVFNIDFSVRPHILVILVHHMLMNESCLLLSFWAWKNVVFMFPALACSFSSYLSIFSPSLPLRVSSAVSRPLFCRLFPPSSQYTNSSWELPLHGTYIIWIHILRCYHFPVEVDVTNFCTGTAAQHIARYSINIYLFRAHSHIHAYTNMNGEYTDFCWCPRREISGSEGNENKSIFTQLMGSRKKLYVAW